MSHVFIICKCSSCAAEHFCIHHLRWWCICGCDGGNSYVGAGCCCCGYKPISRGNELCMSVISGLRSLCLLIDKMCLGGGVMVNPHMHSYPHRLGHPLCVCHWLVWVGPVGGIWSGDYWMKCGFGFKSQHLCNLSEPRIPPRTSSTHKILTPTSASSIVFN